MSVKENEKLKYISNNIKMYRARLGLSQEEVAKEIGVSRATYCGYEINPQKVNMETLNQIANVLKCNLVDFFIPIDVTDRN